MTKEQEAHLRRVKKEFCKLTEKKYRTGQRVHGGNLFRMDPSVLLDNAIDEAIDQAVYLLTLKERLFK